MILAGLERSPFQLPARLADGLGPGSDLEFSYRNSFAPSRQQPFCALLAKVGVFALRSYLPSAGNVGPPRRSAGRRAGVGCNWVLVKHALPLTENSALPKQEGTQS